MKVECYCADAKNKPVIIPLNKWVIEGEKYHIIHVGTTIGSKIPTVTLSEIHLGKEYYPYEGFKLNRFAFTVEGLKQLIELMKSCSELNKVNIDELIEESNLEILENKI